MSNITSISDLASYANGQIVEFPPFAEGQPLVARVRRPSIMALVKEGKIPNSLLTTANTLFTGKGIKEDYRGALADLFQLMDILCENCFLEPTYAEIKSSGMELTDDQFMALFSYTQQGVKALESFRSKPGVVAPTGDV